MTELEFEQRLAMLQQRIQREIQQIERKIRADNNQMRALSADIDARFEAFKAAAQEQIADIRDKGQALAARVKILEDATP